MLVKSAPDFGDHCLREREYHYRKDFLSPQPSFI